MAIYHEPKVCELLLSSYFLFLTPCIWGVGHDQFCNNGCSKPSQSWVTFSMRKLHAVCVWDFSLFFLLFPLWNCWCSIMHPYIWRHVSPEFSLKILDYQLGCSSVSVFWILFCSNIVWLRVSGSLQPLLFSSPLIPSINVLCCRSQIEDTMNWGQSVGRSLIPCLVITIWMSWRKLR